MQCIIKNLTMHTEFADVYNFLKDKIYQKTAIIKVEEKPIRN